MMVDIMIPSSTLRSGPRSGLGGRHFRKSVITAGGFALLVSGGSKLGQVSHDPASDDAWRFWSC